MSSCRRCSLVVPLPGIFVYRLNRKQGDMRSFKAHHVRKKCVSHLHDDTVGCYISVQFSVLFDVRNEYKVSTFHVHIYMLTFWISEQCFEKLQENICDVHVRVVKLSTTLPFGCNGCCNNTLEWTRSGCHKCIQSHIFCVTMCAETMGGPGKNP